MHIRMRCSGGGGGGDGDGGSFLDAVELVPLTERDGVVGGGGDGGMHIPMGGGPSSGGGGGRDDDDALPLAASFDMRSGGGGGPCGPGETPYVRRSEGGAGGGPRAGTLRAVFAQLWRLWAAVVLNFVVTFFVFPGLLSVLPYRGDFGTGEFASEGWWPILLIMVFNLGDVGGRMLSGRFSRVSPACVLVRAAICISRMGRPLGVCVPPCALGDMHFPYGPPIGHMHSPYGPPAGRVRVPVRVLAAHACASARFRVRRWRLV